MYIVQCKAVQLRRALSCEAPCQASSRPLLVPYPWAATFHPLRAFSGAVEMSTRYIAYFGLILLQYNLAAIFAAWSEELESIANTSGGNKATKKKADFNGEKTKGSWSSRMQT